jgi:ribosomal protein S18 acetylase RimI-like enzyme
LLSLRSASFTPSPAGTKIQVKQMLGRRLRRGKEDKMKSIISINPEDHLSSIVSVINRAFQTVANEFGFTKESVSHFPAFIDKAVIEKQINNGLILYGFIHDAELIGCIGIRNLNDNNTFMIERLAVLPEHRHEKIGTVLMDYAINKIIENDGKIAEVEIVNENIRLKKWYLNQGFLEIRIDHYDFLPFTVGVLTKSLV